MINITQIKQTKMAAPKMGRSVRQSASNIPNAGPGDTFPPKFVKIDRATFAKSCYSKQTERKHNLLGASICWRAIKNDTYTKRQL